MGIRKEDLFLCNLYKHTEESYYLKLIMNEIATI